VAKAATVPYLDDHDDDDATTCRLPTFFWLEQEEGKEEECSGVEVEVVGADARHHQEQDDKNTSDDGDIITTTITSPPPRSRSSSSFFEIKIIIFFHSRFHSLMRLLRSIEQAETLKDDKNHQQHQVRIDIFYDGCISKDQEDNDNAAVYHKLKLLRSKHGPMEIICREQHLGLKANVITAWQPAAAAADLSTTCDDDTKNPNSTNTTQYALFLEDDLEVSPFFLRFARDAIIHYGGLSLSSSSSSPLSSSSEQQQQQQQQEGLLGVSLFHELFSEVLHDYVDVAVKQFVKQRNP